MKKWIIPITIGLVCMTSGAWAQSTSATRATAGGSMSGNTVLYSLPQTSLTINVIVQKETIKRGPYARFVQKYLGVVAPLSDKELYTLLGATISYANEADPSAVYVLENPNKSLFDLYTPSVEGYIALDPDGQVPGTPRFAPAADGLMSVSPAVAESSVPELPIDKISTYELGLEEAAAQAAQTLYTLRQRRFDLVTGEAGENVFGAGLQAALDELKRQEDEYIALFMGTRLTQQIVRKCEVVPEAGKNTVIACRFSETGGLLPDNDLSGRPILLEMTPEQKVQNTVLPRPGGRESRGMVFFRVADIVRCRLIDDATVLVDERLPIYQFGQVVEIPVSSLK